MFYFILEPIMMYNWILILAAVIPAVFLMIKVYRADRMEKESGYLLRQLVIAGILSTIIALIEEKIGGMDFIMLCSRKYIAVSDNSLFCYCCHSRRKLKVFLLKKTDME